MSTKVKTPLDRYESTVPYLDERNYLTWSILMEKVLERFHWRNLIEKEYDMNDGNEETPWLRDSMLHHRTLCTMFILEHISSRFWPLFNARENDPCVMWKEIKNVWLPEGPDMQTRFEMQLKVMPMAHATPMEYIAQAKEILAKYHAVGGTKISNTDFIRYIANGLPDGPTWGDLKSEIIRDSNELTVNEVLTILLVREEEEKRDTREKSLAYWNAKKP